MIPGDACAGCSASQSTTDSGRTEDTLPVELRLVHAQVKSEPDAVQNVVDVLLSDEPSPNDIGA